MCTYNGQPYLSEQLDSFASQTFTNWSLWASDDGSDDRTLDILECYGIAWGNERISIRNGPRRGFAANFLSLACDPSIDADYYAFSDQDDIWNPGKLEVALSWLTDVPLNTPALYCARTLLVDEQNNEMGFSPIFRKPPSFSNALLQNIGGGNTMVFNKSARDLLISAGVNLEIVSHDWWTYMVVSGCGGRVLYDPSPNIRYRQHTQNLVGTNMGFAAMLIRARIILRGRFKEWLDINLTAMNGVKDKLTAENRIIFDSFCRARKMPYFIKMIAILSSGVRRKTTLGNIGIVIASLINRI